MSDIWNEFEKMAVEQGLVVDAAEEEEKEQVFEPSKMPTRYDSLSDDAIRLLYNLEPETIFDKKDIIEVAHPESAVICRTYDAMNSIVENVNQRQDMMAYIAQKMPTGHLTQHRYVAAKQELLNSLIRAAFTLDNQEEEELMTLADSCANRVENGSLVKSSGWPLALAVAAGAAILIGSVYYFGWGATTAQNVYANSQMVLRALEDVSDQPYAEGIRSNISSLLAHVTKVYSLKNEVVQIKSVNDAIGEAKQSNKAQEMSKAINSYAAQLRLVGSAIPGWVEKIKLARSTETGEVSDWWAKIKGIADPLYDDRHEEVIEALWGKEKWLSGGRTGGLLEAITNEFKVMGQAIAAANQQKPVIQKGLQQQQMMLAQAPKEKPQTLPPPVPAPPVQKPAPVQQPPAGAAMERPERVAEFPKKTEPELFPGIGQW